MIALALLAAASAYIAVWFFIARALPNWWVRGIAILAALAIPFWDVPYGLHNFFNNCATDAGLKAFSQFDPQKMIYFDYPAGYPPQVLLKKGFDLVEIRKANGKDVVRHRFDPIGAVESKDIVEARSRLVMRAALNQVLPHGLVRHEHALFDRQSNEVVAQFREYSWANWLQRYAMPILGRGMWCPQVPQSDPLLELVLVGSR